MTALLPSLATLMAAVTVSADPLLGDSPALPEESVAILWILFLVVTSASVLGSFICSLCEASLYTVSDAQVAAMVNDRVAGARRLQILRADIDQSIAAILTINTITHTVGASVAGFAIGKLYGSLAVGIFSGVFTLIILIITEIIPKSYGVARAYELAPKMAWIIQLMIWSSYPLVVVCQQITTMINRGATKMAPTEHEILTMTDLAAEHGELEQHQAELIHNAMELEETTIDEIMTPRSVVFVLPDALPLLNLEKQSHHWVHSRLPVVRDQNPNEVLGIVHRREVFDILVSDTEGDRTVADVMHPVRFIRDDATAGDALRLFLAGRQHMFIVHDQYGSWIGIVTLEDVLETLLGQEIVGEHDPVEDMQDLARQRAAAQGLDTSERKDETTRTPEREKTDEPLPPPEILAAEEASVPARVPPE